MDLEKNDDEVSRAHFGFMTATLLSSSAFAWDNCGHGFHRNDSGYCLSNYGRPSGCPYGYHLGWNVHACVPN